MKLKKGLVLLLMCAMILGVKQDVSAAEITYVYDDATTVADLTNAFRADKPWYYNKEEEKVQLENLPALAYDYRLEKIAMIRAAEIVTKFSHERPNGGTSSAEVTALGMNAWGENIAYGQTSATAVVEDWKETNEHYEGQGHRRNMLGGSYGAFTSIGVGHVRSGNVDYWVQIFGTGNGGGTREDLNGTTPPDTDKPGSDKPDTDKPGTDKPDTDGPGTDKPDTDKPGTDKPGTSTPGTNKPGTSTPGTNKPGTSTPGTNKPSTSQPTDENTSTKPDTTITGNVPSSQYNFISGANSIWSKGSGKAMVMKTDGDFSKFVSVEIDGVIVDPKNYTAKSGSTIVSFNADYMETLSAGEHNYRVNYIDGSVDTTFTVDGTATPKDTTTAKAPKTGDNTTVTISMLLILLAFGGIAVSQILKKQTR